MTTSDASGSGGRGEPDGTSKKKRWYRPRNVVLATVLVVVVLIAWPILSVWLVYIDEPAVEVDYRAKMTALSEALQPEGENGWPELAAVLEDIANAGYEEAAPLFDQGDVEAGVALREEIQDAILDNPETLSRLRRALEKPRHVRPWLSSRGELAMNERLPAAVPVRLLGKHLISQVDDAMGRQDWDATVEFSRTMCRFTRVLSLQPAMIWHISASDLTARTIETLAHALNEEAVPAAAASRLETVFAEHELAPTTYAIEAAKLQALDTVQLLHGSRGYMLPLETLFDTVSGPGGLVGMTPIDPANDERSVSQAALARFVFVTRQESEAFVEDYYDSMLDMAARRMMERPLWPPPQVQAKLNEPRYGVAAQLAPSGLRVIDHADIVSLLRVGLKIMLAIERYQADHDGAPPAELEELVPFYMEAIPVDPLTNGAFGYRVLEDDEHGRAYLLYSFGPDMVDGGGLDVNGPPGPFTVPPPGFDYVLNPPREEEDEAP